MLVVRYFLSFSLSLSGKIAAIGVRYFLSQTTGIHGDLRQFPTARGERGQGPVSCGWLRSQNDTLWYNLSFFLPALLPQREPPKHSHMPLSPPIPTHTCPN